LYFLLDLNELVTLLVNICRIYMSHKEPSACTSMVAFKKPLYISERHKKKHLFRLNSERLG